MKAIPTNLTRRRSIYSLIALCFVITILSACQDDSNENPKTTIEEFEGHVQKGPFIIGTSITASELNQSLNQTGKTFSTQISTNGGSFEFHGLNLTSTFVELSSSGF